MAADTSRTSRANRQAAVQLIGSCLRRGIDHFFLAPGSRCTPLTLAVADCPEAKVVQHFDERALAFACLGYGRATGRPGAFICTSGTAVANALPAVVEASLDHVPLLLLTADRPAELRDAGANQTIDQVKIFGNYVRWFFDLPAPATDVHQHFLDSTIRHARQLSADGPVHLNCMFDEPLSAPEGPASDSERTDAASYAVERDQPAACGDSHEHSILQATATRQWKVPPGTALVIAGGMRPSEARAAERLAERLRCPFLADITSGLRGLSYDLQLMRDDNPPAEVVIHCGGRIVSKRWWQFLDRNPPRHYIHLTSHAARINPIHRVTDVLHGPVGQLCDGATAESRSPEGFAMEWMRSSEIARRAAETLIDAAGEITEPGVARSVSELVPDGTNLHLGNSLPVRDMDSFGWWPSDRTVHVSANRGASGIDGSIATAAGLAAGRSELTTAVIGDLAALHDLNSLHLLAHSAAPVILVVVNNDGGGIFHFLPVAEHTPAFERFFATPHGRTLRDAAHMFELPYYQPGSRAEFSTIYRQALEQRRSAIIEARTNRVENRRFHQEIESAVRSAIA